MKIHKRFLRIIIYILYFKADYVIELCDTDSTTLIPMFSETFNNGKFHCVPVIPTDTAQTEPEFALKPSIQSMTLEKIRPKEGTIVQKMKQFTRFLKSEHAISSFKQFLVLFQLMMLKTWRNRTVMWIQFLHHLGCGFFIGLYGILWYLFSLSNLIWFTGLIFYQAANDGLRMFDHLKFCMGVVFVVRLKFNFF